MAAAATLLMEEIVVPVGETDTDPETELVARCRAGEASAYREVYQLHRSAVYGVVARMISIEADREEVVQDAFLQIFKSLGNFRGTAKLSTWAHRVAVNVTLQHIRRKGRRVKLHLREVVPEVSTASNGNATDAESPEGEAMRHERQRAVQRTLDTLAPKKRAALVLADFQGKSSKEIAAIVGAPALTVRTRLFYARKEFYAQLAREPAFKDVDLKGGAK
ncbi:MAG: sigma-70 family RNA polymerase sigma factor [Deltaproteobacteria bacterium]|nr:sigma-70 family RNA polymerase sigma factor [Deltaproteobacteria bacterium]